MSCHVNIKTFDKLSTTELYYILRARAQVFGLEQKIACQDMDEKDFSATHITVYKGTELVGYCRVLPPKLDNPKLLKKYNQDKRDSYLQVDKVLILEAHRGYGLATNLMNQTIQYCLKRYPKHLITIKAQAYLIKFFDSLGFQVASEPYVTNKIKQIDMVHGSKRKIKVKKSKQTQSKTPTSGVQKALGLLLMLLSIMIIAGVFYLAYPL